MNSDSFKKKPLLLTFDDRELLDSRKFFFESGLTIQEAFTSFVELASIRDDRLAFIIERAITNKTDKLMGTKGEKGFKRIEADILYQAIEQENLKQKKE